MHRVLATLTLYALSFLIPAQVQASDWPPASWTTPIPPAHLHGPVYYVGGQELSAYLLVDDDGLILVNVGMEANVDLVFASIRELGYEPQRIRYLLITQGHFDHAGGAARVHELTGAEVVAGVDEVALMEAGGLNDYVFADSLGFPPVETRGMADGAVLTLGNLNIQAVSTPGHTPGSTSWILRTHNEDSRETTMLFQASVSLLNNAHLIDNPLYPEVVADFRATYARLEQIEADFVLPDHLVFARPADTAVSAPVQAQWFQRQGILSAQIKRSSKQLEEMLIRQGKSGQSDGTVNRR
ncbi:MAG: CAU/MBL1b family subclass B3 metallo-beta-lactamase [Wenzhouxiangellaceae bacterium]